MFDIMEYIWHGPLECGAIIFKTKWKLYVGESAPWEDASSFMLILGYDFDLVVPGKVIHE